MSDKWRELYAEECQKTVALEDERNALLTRAEQAEKERGAAVGEMDAATKRADFFARTSAEHKAARERAEADNAALRGYMAEWVAKLRAFPALPGGAVDLVRAEMSVVLESSPPCGVALLERLRAVESALSEISTTCEDKGLRDLDPTDANTKRKLVRALDTAWSTARDALKERKP